MLCFSCFVGAELGGSDMELVEKLVRLRPHLKLSLAEVHRNILLSVVKRGAAVARLVTQTLLEESIANRGGKQEVVKLLIQVLSTLDDESCVSSSLYSAPPDHDCQHTSASSAIMSEVTKKSFTRYEHVSQILGESVHRIVYAARGPGRAGGGTNALLLDDSSAFKILLEDVLRVVRSLGVLSICPALLLQEILGTNWGDQDSLLIPSHGTVDFFADMALAMLLLHANAIVQMDKSIGADSSGSSSRDKISSRGDNTAPPDPSAPGQAASVGAPTGNSLRGGRGGLRGGRGGSIRGTGLASSSGLFRSSAKRSTGATLGKSVTRPSAQAAQQTTGELSHAASSSGGGAPAKSAEAEQNARQIRDFIHLQSAVLREVCLQWFVRYLRSLFRTESSPLSSPEVGAQSHPGEDETEMPPTRLRSGSNVSLDSNGVPQLAAQPSAAEVNGRIPHLVDWLQKVLCLNTQSPFRVSMTCFVCC